MSQLPFAICPVEVFFDSRLTKNQIRVLGAILTFRNRSTNLAHPKREQLSARLDGMAQTRISATTSELVKLGWLKKTGKGGFSKSTAYEFTVPKHITETVTKTVTVTEPVTVTDSVNKTVTNSVTGNKQTSKQTNKEKKNNKKKSFQIIQPDNLNQSAWKDWIDYKQQIKKPYKTERGMQTAMSKLAELSHDQQRACIDSSIANEYQGFFTEKFIGGNNANKHNQKRETTFERVERAIAQADAIFVEGDDCQISQPVGGAQRRSLYHQ